MHETFARLADDRVASFHRDGYLVVDAITTPEEINLLRGVYDRLFAERVGWEEGAMFDLGGAEEDDDKPAVLPQLHWPSKYAPELLDTLHRRNALALARQLLGPEAVPQFEHMILKPGHYGAPTPWHQDEAYWDPALEYNALSIWMPLEDATVDNGCMHFVPGTNASGVLPHHSISNDPRIHGLEIDSIDVTGEVACPIPAGGATVHTSRTVHYAGPNRTPLPRRAYILLFQTPPKKRAQPRDFYWLREKETPRDRRLRSAKPKPR